jgi:hypothetical protein
VVDPGFTRNAPDSTHLHSIPADSNCRGAALLPTKSRQNHSNSSSAQLPEIGTGLGDQGSQVRVLSPRAAANDGMNGRTEATRATASVRSSAWQSTRRNPTAVLTLVAVRQ